MKKYDVIIIGAGVSGCAIARELSRGRRRVAVLERASDVCEGTSKANSGIVHAGYDAVPGTLKARLNTLGSRKMESLSRELDFPYRKNGSLVLCFEREGIKALEELADRGKKNGVDDLKILRPDEVWEMEPNISPEIAGALYAPSGGIVCPFGLNIALAENAAVNGVDFYLSHEVTEIAVQKEDRGIKQEKGRKRGEGLYRIYAGKEVFLSPVVINAAGVYADRIHNMVSSRRISIVPRRGEYCLLDKKAGNMVRSTVFQLPSKMGKGVLVTPTVHGNLMIGPNAEDISDKEGVNTTACGLEQVLDQGRASVKGVDPGLLITSFAGLRAHLTGEGREGDFLIDEADDAEGFFDVAGIESPGLTCAPAIGEYVAEMVNKKYPVPAKQDFQPYRRGIPNIAKADQEERKRLIASEPSYANVICRCEMVTEGEIVNAIHRPLGAVTLDGIKRRTRAGMGRCQAGFCSPRVLEILTRELRADPMLIRKAQPGSEILQGRTKDSLAQDFQRKGEPE